MHEGLATHKGKKGLPELDAASGGRSPRQNEKGEQTTGHRAAGVGTEAEGVEEALAAQEGQHFEQMAANGEGGLSPLCQPDADRKGASCESHRRSTTVRSPRCCRSCLYRPMRNAD